MKKTVLFLIIIATISCSRSKNIEKGITHIDLQTFTENEIKLSEIADDVSYIPLDNEFPIGIVYSFKVTNNFIYAAIKNVGVVRFTKDGKLDKHYGKIGRGPGEYVFCLKFAVDENTGAVYVMDHKMNDIEVYNNNGDHVRNIKLPADDDRFQLDAIEFFGNSLFMAQSINMGRGDHDWVILDTLGNKITEKRNPYPEFKGRMGGMTTLSEFNGNILYWDNFKDTVFLVHPDFTYSPVCVISKGQHKLPMTTEGYNPVDVFFKNMNNYMNMIAFWETNKYFIIHYSLNGSSKIALVDKQNNNATFTELTDSENGIDNDLDNGLPFIPERYFEIGNEKYLAAFIQPFELKKHVASSAFKNSTPKYPERKKALEQLANSLDENDNPVLMLVKLKA